MTDAGSGTAPVEENQTAAGVEPGVWGIPGWDGSAPPGWMWEHDDGSSYLVPDPRHPDHPINTRKRTPGVWRRLDNDADVQSFVARMQPIVAEGVRRFLAIPPHIRRTPRAEWLGSSWLDSVWHPLVVASERLGPWDIPQHSKLRYLVERVFPPEFVPEALAIEKSTSVLLFIGPHGIQFGFWGASPEDRRGYDTLIKNAQKHLGAWQNKGGRPGRADRIHMSPGRTDPADVQSMTAAKLHHWLGWSHAEVAAFLGWTGKPEAVSERVRRAIRAGENSLAAEIGGGWGADPPQAIAERMDMG